MNTVDNFLDGKIKISQPASGFRAGIDSVFLAAAVNPSPGDRVLDVGCGVGVSTLALARKAPLASITGIDIQSELIELAIKNSKLNSLNGVHFVNADIQTKNINGIEPNSFDHVITNPPYYEEGKHRTSPNSIKAMANSQLGISTEEWMNFCVRMLKPGGTMTLINLPEKSCHMSCLMDSKIGDIKIFPLWPGNDKPAKRVLVRGKKGAKGEMQIMPGLVLHNGDKKYSSEAEDILRGNSQINW